MVTGMRFTPLGMIVIATQRDNNSADIAPTLVMGLVKTFLIMGIHRCSSAKRMTAPRRACHDGR